MIELGWSICRHGTHYCLNFPVLRKGCASYDGNDSRFTLVLLGSRNVTNDLLRVRYRYAVASLLWEVSRRNSLEPFALVSKRFSYRRKIGRSKFM